MPPLARDLMQTEVLTVPPEMPFPQIQHLFVVAQVGGVPVVDDKGVVRGVISATDLLRVDDEVDEPDVGDAGELSDAARLPEGLGSLTAIDIATPEVIWVKPECSIFEVAQIMRTEGVHRVLVGQDNRLAGMLTAFDLLQAIPS
jgi:CBS domain-containing protein